MSVDSFAKIDMSLDEIIQLQKKEKRKSVGAAKKTGNGGKKLTVAQRKKAELLKLKAKKIRQTKMKRQQRQQVSGNQIGAAGRRAGAGRGRGLPRLRMDAAKKRANVLKRNKTPMTRGGRVPAARQKQLGARSTSQARQKNQRPRLTRNPQFERNTGQTSQRTTHQRATGLSVKDRLGVRINARQTNQSQKRGQITNANRRGRGGRQASRGSGSGTTRNRTLRINVGNNNFQRNASQNRNRQYNQQPRRGARGQQQVNTQGGSFQRRQRSQQGGASRRFATNVLSQALDNTRGRKRAGRGRTRSFGNKERSVTLY